MLALDDSTEDNYDKTVTVFLQRVAVAGMQLLLPH